MNKQGITFNQSTKAAVLSEKPRKSCCKAAHLLGLLLFGNTFSRREIRLASETEAIIDHGISLIRSVIHMDVSDCKESFSNQYKLWIRGERAGNILDSFGYGALPSAYTLRQEIFRCENCKTEFLKGAFLSCGNISDPEKSYHLEMTVAYFNLSRELLFFLKTIGLEAKYTKRGSHYVIYYKESEKIVDFLATVGAVQENFGFYNTLIKKDLRNQINRINNCETANLQKHISAVARQLEAIRRLNRQGEEEALSPELRYTARLRQENPDASLSELAGLHSPPVTKSCVNRRLNRLMELAGL